MKALIKENKDIIISMIISLIIGLLLGLNRPYKAFGGEDLIPLATGFYWLIRYIETREKK